MSSIPASLSHDERLKRADEKIKEGKNLLDDFDRRSDERALERIQREAKYGAEANHNYIPDQ